jgi:hypothetical protein
LCIVSIGKEDNASDPVPLYRRGRIFVAVASISPHISWCIVCCRTLGFCLLSKRHLLPRIIDCTPDRSHYYRKAYTRSPLPSKSRCTRLVLANRTRLSSSSTGRINSYLQPASAISSHRPHGSPILSRSNWIANFLIWTRRSFRTLRAAH